MLPPCIGLSWIVVDPCSFWEMWTLIGAQAKQIIYSSRNLLFVVCAAALYVSKWILLSLHGYLGPGGVSGTREWEWEKGAAWSYYADCISRNLLSQLLMENTCRKKLVPLKQESKEVHLDCALNQKYLVDFNKKDKDQQRPDPASSGRVEQLC